MSTQAYEFTKRIRPAAFALAGLLFLGACGGDSTVSSPMDDGEPAATTTTVTTTMAAGGDDGAEGGSGEASTGSGDAVTISGFTYSPATLTVASGAEITVTNEDEAVHTLTAKDKSFDTGNLAQGQSASVTIEGSGEIPYFCTIHEYMTGVIRVTD